MSAEGSPAPVDRVRTVDLAAAKYDHEIQLLDSTVDHASGQPKLVSNPSWRSLARNPTRMSVKEQIARRRYARFSQDKYDFPANVLPSVGPSSTNIVNDDVEGEVPEGPSAIPPKTDPRSETVDFAQPANDQQPAPTPQMAAKANKKVNAADHRRKESEIEILYENQRGSFLCGIPLYSHSSLLNFDPSAWVNKDFQNSPVNITNAQVPDPSWIWSWKSWYVDMAGDVDEQGWQYSFAFGNKWSWHGTHPWLTSFARRRRWLRRREKRTKSIARPGTEGNLEAAHHLNNDYFTIHSKSHGRAPADLSNPEMQLARPESFRSFHSILEQEEEKPEDIRDIPALERAIRRATVDRVKIDAVKTFVNNDGDEIFYLADKIPDIMSTLVFQNSRRQILEFLKDSAQAAQEHRDEHETDNRPEGADEKRKIDNLLRAARVAGEQIQGLEYWSDRKHILQTADESDENTQDEKDIYPDLTQSIGEIKGISDDAEISKEIRVDRRLTNKGKQPAKLGSPQVSEEEQNNTRATPMKQLEADSIFIPD